MFLEILGYAMRACCAARTLARLALGAALTPRRPPRSAECANLGLKLLARGGVFIAGGIPGKLLSRIRATDALQRGFLRPGSRFERVRASMPLRLLLAKDPGLDGARAVAVRALRDARA